MKKIRSVPDNVVLVTADVVILYPSIPHSGGLKVLKKALENRDNKQILISDLVQMAEKVFKQILGTTIGTKFVPPYTYIYMDEVGTAFLPKI